MGPTLHLRASTQALSTDLIQDLRGGHGIHSSSRPKDLMGHLPMDLRAQCPGLVDHLLLLGLFPNTQGLMDHLGCNMDTIQDRRLDHMVPILAPISTDLTRDRGTPVLLILQLQGVVI